MKDVEPQFERFMEMVPALAWRASADGSREFHTRAWHDFTGLSAEEARGWGWTRAIHPDDVNLVLNEWTAIRASGSAGAVETRVRRADGQYRWFSVSAVPFRDTNGAIVSWYGCNTDIEDRKRTQLRLSQDEEALSKVTDAISELIAVIALDDSLIYANHFFRLYTGRGTTDVADGSFRRQVFHPDEIETMTRNRRKGLHSGEPFMLEQRVRRHDGEYLWHEIRYSPLRDGQGRIIRWYSTGHDIHARRIAETRLQNENLALREEITRSSMFEEIVGSSKPMRQILSDVSKVAPTDSTVLILGETGTGKELVARAVHTLSPRKEKAFIRVNCAAIPPALIASELFGHEKGAFTGALQRRLGRFEAADGGTLFLDEIGDLPAETQVALLRVLQEREIERVGSNRPISVDVRVVAATHRNLLESVSAGTFRQDLFYRLNVFPIRIPSLRERVADIPLLVEYFIDRYARKAGKHILGVSRQTMALLEAYEWPGNIRELQNIVERSVILCDGETFSIEENWLKNQLMPPGAGGATLNGALAEQERALIRSALAESGGRLSGPRGAAAKLRIPRQTLASKMKSLGIRKP